MRVEIVTKLSGIAKLTATMTYPFWIINKSSLSCIILRIKDLLIQKHNQNVWIKSLTR